MFKRLYLKYANHINLILFVFGLLLSILSFYLSNSDKIDWVNKILYPEYYRAKIALSIIDDNRVLVVNDKGMDKIESILKDYLRTIPENKKKLWIIDEAKLHEISKTMGGFNVSSTGEIQFLGAKFIYQNKIIPINNIDYKIIKNGVDQLKNGRYLSGNIFLFWVGIIIMVLSKLIEILPLNKLTHENNE
jgi:hypothetical protein